MGTLTIVAAVTVISWITLDRPAVSVSQIPFFHSNKSVEYQTYQSPTGSFSIDYPKRDWKIGASGMTVLAQFMHKNGLVGVLIEQKLLDRPWSDSDTNELTAQVMTANLKNRFPNAESFGHEIRKGTHGSVVIVDFTKPASTGTGDEKRRFYFVFSGTTLYTIECTAPLEAFPKYADVFDHMAVSFKPGPPK
jgi:hypothetical protein